MGVPWGLGRGQAWVLVADSGFDGGGGLSAPERRVQAELVERARPGGSMANGGRARRSQSVRRSSGSLGRRSGRASGSHGRGSRRSRG